MDDDVGAGQVETCPARLQRYQEDRRVVVVKVADELEALLLRRIADDLVIRDLLFLEVLLKQLEHARELREEQNLVLAIDSGFDELDRCLALR